MGCPFNQPRPACALPSPADQRLMQSSCLFPSLCPRSHPPLSPCTQHGRTSSSFKHEAPGSCHIILLLGMDAQTHPHAARRHCGGGSLRHGLNQDLRGDYDTYCQADLADRDLCVGYICCKSSQSDFNGPISDINHFEHPET